MNNKKKIAILIIFLGWLMIGIGYGEPLPQPINSVLFLLGLVFFIVGLVLLMTKNKPNK
jgi:drug/metabolite transporter (DMT)-like permease